MGNDWIVGVLADLKNFAQKNDLPLLADHLDETSEVAKAEIAQISKRAPMPVRGDCAETGSIFTDAGAGRDA